MTKKEESLERKNGVLCEVLKVQGSKERKYLHVAFARQKILSSIAQSVEHAAVNRAVVGSSPTRGVKNKDEEVLSAF